MAGHRSHLAAMVPATLSRVITPSELAAFSADRPPGSLDTGVRSLEVRWILPGELATAMAGWFGRFPAETKVLEDSYLVDPLLPGLSVKVRQRQALEVKVYHGSAGLLEVAGRTRGRLETWQKWSFPHGPPSHGSGDPAGWQPVRKRRRISQFSLGGGPAQARGPELSKQQGCAVELTEVRTRGEAWWTLGFETTGPVNTLRSELDAAAALVFAQALPGGMELDIDDSSSYAQWLRRLGAGTGAEA
jgi:hypothetical protein